MMYRPSVETPTTGSEGITTPGCKIDGGGIGYNQDTLEGVVGPVLTGP